MSREKYGKYGAASREEALVLGACFDEEDGRNDEECKDGVARQYMQLVKSIARRVYSGITNLDNSLTLDDLESYGFMGLLDSVGKYDANRDAFLPYAAKRIKGSIFDGIRGSSHLSRTVMDRKKNLIMAISKLEQELLRRPDTDEILKELSGKAYTNTNGDDDNPEYILRDGQIPSGMNSLDSTTTPDDSSETTLVETLPSWSGSAEESFFQGKYIKDEVSKAIHGLNNEKWERVIVGMYYEGKDTVDLAEELRVSQPRISQIKRLAESKLRDILNED